MEQTYSPGVLLEVRLLGVLAVGVFEFMDQLRGFMGVLQPCAALVFAEMFIIESPLLEALQLSGFSFLCHLI